MGLMDKRKRMRSPALGIILLLSFGSMIRGLEGGGTSIQSQPLGSVNIRRLIIVPFHLVTRWEIR